MPLCVTISSLATRSDEAAQVNDMSESSLERFQRKHACMRFGWNHLQSKVNVDRKCLRRRLRETELDIGGRVVWDMRWLDCIC